MTTRNPTPYLNLNSSAIAHSKGSASVFLSKIWRKPIRVIRYGNQARKSLNNMSYTLTIALKKNAQ